MRSLYSFLFYLALPFLIVRLWLRSLRQPAYRQRVKERFGYYPVKFERSLWVHVVSVGEVLAAVPLIKALKIQYPDLPVVVTTMTPTGAERVKSAFAESVTHLYVPYDYPGAVHRFLQAVNPRIAVIMETELWPNLLAAAREAHIPVFLANARLSEKSARGYQRIASLMKEMLQGLTMIAAHGHQDAQRFIELGADPTRVQVTGNIKFDLELPATLATSSQTLRAALGEDRFVWIAASTHEGEEEIVLAAHRLLREKNPHALLILVPRHPDRFNAIANLAANEFKVSRRSLQEKIHADTGVYLGDTMGELLLMYGAADVTFVGGSLITRGGHNILEAGALAKPILSGPSLYNFTEISELFSAANALIKVTDAKSLAEQLIFLMEHEKERLQFGERSLQVVAANRGALAKQMSLIKNCHPGESQGFYKLDAS